MYAPSSKLVNVYVVEIPTSIQYCPLDTSQVAYFLYPLNNSWINTTEFYVIWDYEDSSGISSIRIKIDNSSWIPLQPDMKEYFVMLSEGIHTVMISVTDFAENTAVISNTVKIDVSPPKIKIDISKEYITLNATDNLSGVEKIMYSIDGNIWETYSGKISISNLTSGHHNITVIAIDHAGNTETCSKTFTVVGETPHLPESGNNCFLPIIILLIVIIILSAILLITIFHYKQKIYRIMSNSIAEQKPLEGSQSQEEQDQNSEDTETS